MQPVHADYPFLDAAREAVRDAELDLTSVIAGAQSDGTRHPAVERGVERVRRALLDGTVEPPEGERHPGVQTELLSYPVARVLVSMLETPGAVEKYADAEARTAYERFTDDFEDAADDFRSAERGKVTLNYLLSEFDLADAVRETADGYRMAVTAYLPLASGFTDDDWRLVARQLSDGAVALETDELHELLREAVRRRVADGLPSNVPDEIGDELTDEVAALRDSFSEVEISRNIDVLAPDRFPPCVTALLDRARDGETLPPHSAFALTSFLASVGADTDEIAALTGANEGRARSLEYRVARVADDGGAQYLPPTCETMQAYGDCVNEDDRCETISHPLAYYEDALADAENVHDWRETES